jgi:polyhydroxyalkanoate synthesis regulator phasin
MSEKKKSRVSKVSRVFNQARESLKLLETLEKETLAKARTFVRNPIQVGRKKKAKNEKFVVSLKSLGLITRSDLEKLDRKIEALQSEIATLREELTQSGKIKLAKTNSRPAPSAEAFPNT